MELEFQLFIKLKVVFLAFSLLSIFIMHLVKIINPIISKMDHFRANIIPFHVIKSYDA